jgi:DNA primase
VRILAERYGVPLVLREGRDGRRSGDEKERLTHALEVARGYFEEQLAAKTEARSYLFGRGIPDQWIATIGFGFAPDSWDGIHGRLRAKGVDVGDAVSAGLIKERSGGGHYDYFRSRIMIPIRDLSGRLVAFGGRIFGEGDPKYLNSPESPVFRKRGFLFGLETAREAIRREGTVILVEGYFDQISLRIRGFENTVAPLGTALGQEQVRLIRRFTDQVVTVFDGDEAGLHAVRRCIPLFLAEGIEPRCVILKEDKDPDEAVNRIGQEGFRRLLDHAGPMVDFLLDSIAERHDLGTLRGRNLAVEECLPALLEIANSRAGDYFIERVSSRTRVREDRLRHLMKSRSRERTDSRVAPPRSRIFFDSPAHERNVVRGMLLREGFIDRVLESGVLKDLEDPILSGLAARIVSYNQQTGRFDPVLFAGCLEDANLSELVAQWLKPRPEEDDLRPEFDGDQVMDQSLDAIRLRKLEKRKEEIKQRMKQCVPGDEEYNVLATELSAIAPLLRK